MLLSTDWMLFVGNGERLVKALFEQARLYGYKKVLLDSPRSMTKAHDVYRKLGLGEVDAPPDFPEEQKQVVVFMVRTL